MIVMPANATGWFFHCLARETGRIGHLLSPGAQRGPWPWMPYALDNGAFSCWEPTTNTFDAVRWEQTETAWRHLLMWAQCAPIKARWAIVPDVPGDGKATLARWPIYAPDVVAAGIPLALAVQDGMEVGDVADLTPPPEVICVGGSTEWKWATVNNWANCFRRVHLLRCNAPDKLPWLEGIGIESTDGTGWNRGDRKQTAGLERWARSRAVPVAHDLWPHASRAVNRKQLCFA